MEMKIKRFNENIDYKEDWEEEPESTNVYILYDEYSDGGEVVGVLKNDQPELIKSVIHNYLFNLNNIGDNDKLISYKRKVNDIIIVYNIYPNEIEGDQEFFFYIEKHKLYE